MKENNSILPQLPFGKTGLNLTPLCMGSSALGDMIETFDFSVSEEQALATLQHIFNSPIRCLDTSPVYRPKHKIC